MTVYDLVFGKYGDSCNGQGQLQRHIVFQGPVIFRTDSGYPQKSRSDLNKENRVLATLVSRYFCVMIYTCTRATAMHFSYF